jgi:threonine dehydratase
MHKPQAAEQGGAPPPLLADVRAAARRIRELVHRTPLRPSLGLHERLGRPVHLKLESMQPTGAFKLRGAANHILSLPQEQQQRGVITQSSGNHGRAVAYVARQLAIPAVVCLSQRVPEAKVAAIRSLGAEVVVEGGDQEASMAVAERLTAERGLTFIPPFDDPDVIAGQGTIALELFEQRPSLDSILVPVSGGGLAAGVALAAKALAAEGLAPSVRVFGVSQAQGAAVYESLRAGRQVEVEEPESWADALIGSLNDANRYTLALCRELLDDVVLVSEEEIERGLLWAFRREHLILEGGGAVGLAALLARPRYDWGHDVAVLCTGDNIDSDRIAELARRVPEGAPS